MADAGERMAPFTRNALLVYLALSSLLFLYLVYGVWGAAPAAPPTQPLERPALGQKPDGDGPAVSGIRPETLAYGAARPTVLIFGHNFTADSRGLLGGSPRDTEYLDENGLLVNLRAQDFVVPGPVSVAVQNDKGTSNAKKLMIETSAPLGGVWRFLGKEINLSVELRLVLLVLFTGAFGATIAALQSLGDYRGRKKLGASWAMFYIVRPPVGAGVALIIYLAVRGGFLAGSDVDVGMTTPFGIVAVSALAGMFSDRAYQKLAEVARNLFSTDRDTRGDTLGGPAIKTVTLGRTPHGSPYTGGQPEAFEGKLPYTWSPPTPPLPAGLSLDPATGQISGTPTEAVPKRAYTFKVTDRNGDSASAKLELEVT